MANNNKTQWRLLFLMLALTFPAAAQEAADWHVSQYGPEDTLGAINNLSEAGVKTAARLVRRGKTYALGVPSGKDTPAYPPRWYHMTVLKLDAGDGATLGENMATGYDDLLTTFLGIGSQIDGLGHIGINHVYYNGTPAAEFMTPQGLTKFSTHKLPPIVTRGILLDMTIQTGRNPVPAGTVFNTRDIVAAAQRARVTIKRGDVVLFHTGWLAVAATDPKKFIETEPGLGVGGAQYLASLGVVAIGSDTAAVEVLPPENPNMAFPVHTELLAKNGVYLLEVMNTKELAADQATTFMFVLGQPRFVGSVQAIINPVAIR